MFQRGFIKAVAILAIVLILAGCGPAAAPTISPENLKATNDAVVGDAVKTVQADMTKNAPPTNTPVPPTNTPEPTNTPIPATDTPAATSTTAPTNTPLPPTRPAFTNTPSRTATQANTSCLISEYQPAPGDNTLAPGADFDARWVVKNTSGSTWAAGDTDLKYVSGTKMQDRDMYDIQSDVKNGDSVTVVADMVAPGSEGGYYASWAIVSGGKTVCSLPVSITVKKP